MSNLLAASPKPASVYDIAIKTPLDYGAKMSDILGNSLYYKREDTQAVHSFKIRGAYNKMAQLAPKDRAKGVIAASAGNHAQGVAQSAQKLEIPATIVMPVTTPSIKVEAVKRFGADVILHGDNFSEAYEYSQEPKILNGKIFIHPYDDPDVIAGQGTVGQEIVDDLPGTDFVFVPIGGGGLIAGVAEKIKKIKPDVKIIGVEPVDSNAMQLSWQQGKRVTLKNVGIFADGVAVKQVGELTLAKVQEFVDDIITVTTDETCAAIKDFFEERRTILEPAGALSIAGAKQYIQNHKLQGKNIVAICSGANMTFERLQFVAERTLLGSKKESLFVVTLPEQPGALGRFCDKVVNGRSISEFNYRINSREQAQVLVGIAVSDEPDRQIFKQVMIDNGYVFVDITDDEIAKAHIRHMVGGPAPKQVHEYIYDIQFPERPRALSDFLKSLGNEWNISLFHYRSVGGDISRVLIGFEASNEVALKRALRSTGYQFQKEESDAVKLLL